MTTRRQNDLARWRAKIDVIDGQLVRLLDRRARLAAQIAVLKNRNGLPVRDRRREQQVLKRICRAKRGPFSELQLKAIFRSIIRESLRLERSLPDRREKNSSEEGDNNVSARAH
jgi:chorismate mutase